MVKWAVATPSRPSRVLAWTGYYSFAMLGVQTVVLPSLIRSIEQEFHQGDAAFGVLYLLKSVLYAVGAFSGGFLTERYGRRVVLPGAAILSTASLLVAVVAPGWTAFAIAGAVVSLGWAVIDAGVNALFLDLFREARGGALNFLHLFFSVGAFAAPLPIGLLVTVGVSWRLVLLGSAVSVAIIILPLARTPMPSGRWSRESGSHGDETAPAERSIIPFLALAAAIALYVGAELGVSSWVVKLLSDRSVVVGTAALSTFWFGLAVGRLVSKWFAEVLEYTTFTILCVILASISLVGAVLVPWTPVALVLYGLCGLFNGPIYPMIMAIGGQIYPHRLAALSGGLTTGASLGTIVYPPLMGLMADRIGLRVGMLGAALLGIPAVIALALARGAARRASRAVDQPPTERVS